MNQSTKKINMYIGNNLVWLLGDTGFFPASKVVEGEFHFKGIRSTEKSKWEVMVLKSRLLGIRVDRQGKLRQRHTAVFQGQRSFSRSKAARREGKILARRDN
jgi:hypothetical protein